jgi:hypothetical protein
MHLVGPAVFGLTAGQELIQGYVRIQSTSGRFAGSVRFTDPGQTSFGSALNLVSTGKTTAFFSQVAQDARYYTGLAAVNPTPRSATVSVTVYGTDGRTMASGRIQISAAGRFSRLLPELVGALPSMSRGFFQVASNEPIICFALFGTHDGKVLAAIPAQSP